MGLVPVFVTKLLELGAVGVLLIHVRDTCTGTEYPRPQVGLDNDPVVPTASAVGITEPVVNLLVCVGNVLVAVPAE